MCNHVCQLWACNINIIAWKDLLIQSRRFALVPSQYCNYRPCLSLSPQQRKKSHTLSPNDLWQVALSKVALLACWKHYSNPNSLCSQGSRVHNWMIVVSLWLLMGLNLKKKKKIWEIINKSGSSCGTRNRWEYPTWNVNSVSFSTADFEGFQDFLISSIGCCWFFFFFPWGCHCRV